MEFLTNTPDIIKVVASAAAVYGAIRADLKTMKQSLDRAHERIDKHIDDHAAGSFRK